MLWWGGCGWLEKGRRRERERKRRIRIYHRGRRGFAEVTEKRDKKKEEDLTQRSQRVRRVHGKERKKKDKDLPQRSQRVRRVHREERRGFNAETLLTWDVLGKQ